MRLTALAVLGTALAGFQLPSPPLEQGVLRLHYVQKPIGYERYTIAREGE
jgi:hypothetical protein